jgi:hypothetical protein
MDTKELQEEVIEFRDARDWAQYQSKRSEVRTSGISGEAAFKLELNGKKYLVEKAKGSARKYTEA